MINDGPQHCTEEFHTQQAKGLWRKCIVCGAKLQRSGTFDTSTEGEGT